MSDSYVPGQPTGKVDAAKHEAADLKETATEQAANVAGTAKDEAAGVAREAKSQAKDLYAQTQAELKDQAGRQQQRVASGLRSLGDELGSMASSSESQGLASDLVRQVSERAGGAASWLDARDPGSLLSEVKSYARRKPGTFIAAAAIAGVVAGRLTRALAGAAADEKDAATSSPSSTSVSPASTLTEPAFVAPVTTPVATPAVAPVTTVPPVVSTPTYASENTIDDTPLYTERASTFADTQSDTQPTPDDGYQR